MAEKGLKETSKLRSFRYQIRIEGFIEFLWISLKRSSRRFGRSLFAPKFSGPAILPEENEVQLGKFDNLLRGIVFTVLAGACFSTMDAFGKQLTVFLPVIMIVWGRYFFQTVAAGGILFAREGPRVLITNRPLIHFLRGAALFCATLLLYNSLAFIPLADATSAFFCTPIIVTILSVIVLKERIGIHRIVAILTGFLGILLVVRPGFSENSFYLMLPVGAAFMNAVYLLLTRMLSTEQERRAAQIHTTSVGAVGLTLFVLPTWVTPEPMEFAGLVVMGVLGMTGHFSLLKAMSYAPASVLSPFLYSQVLAATTISVFWFGDALKASTLLGTVILVGSGIYIWWRERVVYGELDIRRDESR